jgi:hypothetical protein
MNLNWRLTHFIPMEWDDAIKFQYGEYKLPTIKQLQEAFNQGIKGFESRHYWSRNEHDFFKQEAWLFDFKQGLPFKSDKRVNLYVRLCK